MVSTYLIDANVPAVIVNSLSDWLVCLVKAPV